MRQFNLLLTILILALFVSQGCSNQVFAQGVSEAMEAIFMKDYEKAREIINSGIDVNEKHRDSYLLNVACYRGDLELVQLLLNNGADVNVVAGDGATPLVWAGQGDKTGEIVSLLLKKGAKIDAENKLGTSAFDNAARSYCTSKNSPSIEVLEILADHGADVDNPIPDGEAKGYTNLTTAIVWNKIKLVRFLIDRGADINFVAADGNTPLMLACREGNLAMVNLLIVSGATTEAVNNNGETALQLAEKNKHEEIVQYLSHR